MQAWWPGCAPTIRLWIFSTNQRPVYRSRDQYWPIRGEHCRPNVRRTRRLIELEIMAIPGTHAYVTTRYYLFLLPWFTSAHPRLPYSHHLNDPCPIWRISFANHNLQNVQLLDLILIFSRPNRREILSSNSIIFSSDGSSSNANVHLSVFLSVHLVQSL